MLCRSRLPFRVLDVAIDDEVQFFVREAVLAFQVVVNLVDDGLGRLLCELVVNDPTPAMLKLPS